MKKQMIRTTSRAWNAEGCSGVHKLAVRVEFTGCEWKVLEIVSESGRPAWANPLNDVGAVSAAFINNPAMLARLGYTEVGA